MLIEWNSTMSVGVEIIDKHHQHLVALINQLFEAMRQEQDEEVIDGVLHELNEYVQYHFSYEEELMRECSYPGYEQHCNEHKQLAESLNVLQERHSRGRERITVEVMHFLRDWLQRHILESDMGYVSYLSFGDKV